MPNFFSAFTTDVFRPIATLLIPGAIAISTWFVALLWHFTALKELVSEKNHSETGLVLLLAMIFAGMVVDDLGSRYESRLDRKADKRTSGAHMEEWKQYLRLAFKEDPVGRRYLRTLVMKLKFELGIGVSMISAGTGLIWLALLGLPVSTVVVAEIICGMFILWGFIEANATHKVLAENRTNLLRDIRVIG
jgi:hypothetical protein